MAIAYVGVMKHDPADFSRSTPDASAQDEIDRRLDAFIESLPPCPGLPSTDDEIAASLARARADVAAGRVHSHAIVGDWLKTVGTPDFRRFKEWLAARDA